MTARSPTNQPEPAMPADALWLSSAGLRIGRRLIHRSENRDQAATSRLEAVLAFAFGQLLTPREQASIGAAQALARRGDLAAANIRLAIVKLQRVPAASTVDHRLSVAEQSLDAGVSAADLLKALETSDVLARGYDPTEPRVPAHSGDHGGEWTRAGGATAAGSGRTERTATTAPIPVPSRPVEHGDHDGAITDVQYRSFYHDSFIEEILKQLSDYGSMTFANVSLIGLDGITAIADGASLPKEGRKPYFIDAKTGLNPSFTPNQQHVYDLLCVGGHVISNDARIEQLGLKPGVPLPPMDVMIVRTLGPGQKI